MPSQKVKISKNGPGTAAFVYSKLRTKWMHDFKKTIGYLSDDDEFEPVPAEHKRKKVICDSYDGETSDGDDPAPSLDVTLRKLINFTGCRQRSSVTVNVGEFRRLVLAEVDPAVSSSIIIIFVVHDEMY